MSDLVERLKSRAAPLTRARELSPTAALCREAAVEIERLRGLSSDVAQKVQVPDGYVLMPSEPSQQLIDRMTASISVADVPSDDDPPDRDYDYDMRKAYRAALSLAAQPPAAPVEAGDYIDPITAEEYFRGTLKVIAHWAEVDLSGEWETGLRGIIRSITDAAKETLSAHPEGKSHQSCSAETGGQNG